MADFEEGPLKKFTPCRPGTLDQVAEAPGSHQRGTDAYPPIPGREWTCRAAPHDPHGTPSRAASPILWDSGRTEATRVLSGSASGTRQELRADAEALQQRDPEVRRNPRGAVGIADLPGRLSRLFSCRRTPSIPVDVDTAIQNIFLRLAGSCKKRFVSMRLLLSMLLMYHTLDSLHRLAL